MMRTIDIRRNSAAPIAAREALRGVPGRFRRGDADLLVTELVTNAVRHGSGTQIHLLLDTTDTGGLRCEVIDGGDGFWPAPTLTRGDEAGGWGLYLIDALSDGWGVYEGSTHVWFELGSG